MGKAMNYPESRTEAGLGETKGSEKEGSSAIGGDMLALGSGTHY